jgi:hypothetical protein
VTPRDIDRPSNSKLIHEFLPNGHSTPLSNAGEGRQISSADIHLHFSLKLINELIYDVDNRYIDKSLIVFISQSQLSRFLT